MSSLVCSVRSCLSFDPLLAMICDGYLRSDDAFSLFEGVVDLFVTLVVETSDKGIEGWFEN